MIISDEAVEAAAKAIYESESYQNRWDWPLSEFDREEYRKHARAALEAAAPHIAAEAWEQAYGKGYSDAIWQHGHNPRESNPYRSQA